MNHPYYYLPKWLGGMLSVAVLVIMFGGISDWIPEKHWLMRAGYLLLSVTMLDMFIATRHRDKEAKRNQSV